MRTAAELVRELRSRGVELRAEGEVIRFRPRDAVTPEIRDALSRLKREVLALLTAPAPARVLEPSRTCPCPSCGSPNYWALATVGYWVCAGCHAPDFAPSELVWMQIDRGGAA